MTNLSTKTLLAGVAGAWLLTAAVFVAARPAPSAAAARSAAVAPVSPGR